ncbi:MAG: TIGR03545 family protein [Oleibacter sp.]|nr:TIGR03545 family protein [Thalassolituus sp.]
MKQWIRWQGLVGFGAFVAVLFLLITMALPWLIGFSIEYVGSRVMGAKVSIDDVNINVSPFGIELRHMQVADAREPMRNLFEFDKVVADLELAPLIVGKAISHELSLTNLQFHTERTSSGAISNGWFTSDKEDKDKKSIVQSTVDKLPTVDEILANETLKTPQAGERVKEVWKDADTQVSAAVDGLPDEEKLQEYRQRVNTITSGRLESLEDFTKRKAELDALKKTFEADKKSIKTAQSVVQTNKQNLQQALQDLSNAPQQDLDYLKDKYQLNAVGAENLAVMLFGDDVSRWANEARYWYGRVQPYLNQVQAVSKAAESDTEEEIKPPRLAGRFVHFPTSDPWPDFMIRKAFITGPFDGGKLEIRGDDITHQQAIIGRPTRLTATGYGLQSIGDLDGRLTLNHVKDIGEDTLTLSISDWRLRPIALGIAGAELSNANLAINSKAEVIAGQLSAVASADVRSAKFSGSGQTLFAKELNNALSGINRFSLKATAEGDLLTPKVGLSSNLDRQIKVALQQRVDAKEKELTDRLKSRLNKQVEEYAGEYAPQLQALISRDASMSVRMDELQNLLSSELEDFKTQQEREAKEKLEEEKSAAKAKAKEEADRKKEEVKDNAVNKLKGLF